MRLLQANGFNSRLSLGNLDLTSPDASSFLDQLNYGQKCLLKGLTKLCRAPSGDKASYETAASKAAGLSMASKNASIKEKIGKLFHFDTGSKSRSDFQPTVAYKAGGTKRKSLCTSSRSKGPAKKVKEMKVKVQNKLTTKEVT